MTGYEWLPAVRETDVNWLLLSELLLREHPNEAAELEPRQALRITHHLLDLAATPRLLLTGEAGGERVELSAEERTYLAVRALLDLRGRLDRLRDRHVRETGAGGTVGTFCVECGSPWPCSTRELIDSPNAAEGDE